MSDGKGRPAMAEGKAGGTGFCWKMADQSGGGGGAAV
jgi:hypothetical protein